ncbi:hypothetical protein BC629DRAFT_1505620 [Irpex lacteus]|nr:hypothetical protein BC629DRAFT_1505620 [Irpex lacteus]
MSTSESDRVDDPPASDTSSNDELDNSPLPIDTCTESNSDNTGILSLPNEIISHVFIQLSIVAPIRLTRAEPVICHNLNPYSWDRDRSINPQVNRLGCLIAAHICRRLRDIALGTPELWNDLVIVEDSARWLPHVLQRSGNRNLSLLFHPPLVFLEHAYHRRLYAQPWKMSPADINEACTILHELDVLARIEHVKIECLYHWLPFAQSLLASPSPRLKTLHLTPHEPRPDSVMVVLPPSLLQSSAPYLCHLTLNQCDFSWSSLSHFSTLTTLKLTRPEMVPGVEYAVMHALPTSEAATQPTHRTNAFGNTPMEEVLASLRALPLLEDVLLMNVLPSWRPTPQSGGGEFLRLELPNLRTIAIIQSRLDPACLILDLLDAPQLCEFELGSWTIARPLGADLQDRYARLSRFLSRFTNTFPLPITCLSLDFGVPEIVIRAQCMRPRSSDAYFLTITLGMLETPETPETFPIRHTCVEPILTALPLTSLERLVIQDQVIPVEDKSYYDVDFVFWRRMYDLCSSATQVEASSLALVPLLPLLSCRNLPHWRFTTLLEEPRTPVFPNLDDLEVRVDHLARRDRGVRVSLMKKHPRLKDTDSTTVYLEILQECLASRMEYATSNPLVRKLEYLRVRVELRSGEECEARNLDSEKFYNDFCKVVVGGERYSGRCELDVNRLQSMMWYYNTQRSRLW